MVLAFYIKNIFTVHFNIVYSKIANPSSIGDYLNKIRKLLPLFT